jgi:CheY-like chemotaxis protein
VPEPGGLAAVRGGTEGLLVVEDDAAVRSLVSTCLRRLGYRVLEARTGREALEVWRQHQDTIDLLLTDMVMPEGVSGRELAAELRAAKPTLKVIYTSGYSVDLTAADLHLQEGVNFLPKPYPPHRLAQTVRACLDTDQTHPRPG